MRSELERLCERKRVRADVAYGTEAPPDGFPSGSNPWRVTLRYQGRQLTVPFYTGPAIEREPSAADVLNCICSDTFAGEQTFEEFCSEFGYDPDSRKAERTWKACAAMAPRVRRLLGADFDTFARAEH